MDELIAKIREYSHLAATLSNQAGEIPSTPKESRKQKMELMRQVRDANRHSRNRKVYCRVFRRVVSTKRYCVIIVQREILHQIETDQNSCFLKHQIQS